MIYIRLGSQLPPFLLSIWEELSRKTFCHSSEPPWKWRAGMGEELGGWVDSQSNICGERVMMMMIPRIEYVRESLRILSGSPEYEIYHSSM